MKKLLSVLLIAAAVFASQDSIISSGKWSNNAIWSLGTPPTSSDTVYSGYHSTVNDTMDANYEIKAFYGDSVSRGKHTREGYTLTVNGTGRCYVDLIGAVTYSTNYGEGLTFTSEKATMVMGGYSSTAIVGSNCIISLVNGDSVLFKQTRTWESFTLGETDTVYFKQTAGDAFTFQSDNPLTCGNNCAIYCDNLYLYKTNSGAIINPGTNLKFMTGTVRIGPVTSGASCTLPELLGASGVTFYLMSFATGSSLTSITCNGNVTVGTLYLGNIANNNYQMVNFNTHNITCTKIYWYDAGTTYSDSIVFGSGTHTISTISTWSGMTGTKFYTDWSSCVLNISTLAMYPSMKSLPGTSEIVFSGSIEPSGKSFYNISNSAGTGGRRMDGAFNCHNFTISEGSIYVNNTNSYPLYLDTTGKNDTIDNISLTSSSVGTTSSFWNDTMVIKNNFVVTTTMTDPLHPYKVRFITAANHNVTGSTKNLGKFMLINGGKATLLSRLLCKVWNDSVGTTFTNGYTLRSDSLLVIGDSVYSADSIKCAGNVRVKSGMRSNIAGFIHLDSSLAATLTGAGTDVSKSLGKLEFKKTANGVTQSGAIRAASIGFIDGTFSQTNTTDTIRSDSTNVASSDSVLIRSPIVNHKKLIISGSAKTQFSSIQTSFLDVSSGTFSQTSATDTIRIDSINVSSTDSARFIAPIVVRKKLILSVGAKIRFAATSKLITIPGDTLIITAGGQSLPRIVNKSVVIYR